MCCISIQITGNLTNVVTTEIRINFHTCFGKKFPSCTVILGKGSYYLFYFIFFKRKWNYYFFNFKGTLTVHHFFKGISLHIFFQIFIVLHYSQILELKQHLQKLYYLTREKKQWIVKIKCVQWRFGHWLWRPNNWHDISIMLISEKKYKRKINREKLK